MKKKIVPLSLLSVLLLGTLLSACGSSEEKPQDSTQPVQQSEEESSEVSETENITPLGLPAGLDYEGYTCHFTSRGASTIYYSDLWAEALNADTINDTVYNRNKLVEELLNINLQVVTGSNIKESVMAGDADYDFLTNKVMFEYAQAGLLLDWNEYLPYVDLEAEWWDADAADKFEIYDKLYVMIGDLSWQSMGSAMCILFNKRLFSSLDIEEPYQTVLDGEWTYERFDQVAMQGGKDLNGDGKIEWGDDRYGYVSYDWYGPNQFFYSADLRTTGKDDDGGISLVLNSERSVDVLSSLTEFFGKEYTRGISDRISAHKAFLEGRAVMISDQLKYVSELRDMKDDFGIIPFPKYDEAVEKYCSTVDIGTNLFGVPVTNNNPERTSAILEALCYYGWRDVVPTYFNVVLESKYARDSESWKMLELIHNGRVYDTGFFYLNSTIGTLNSFFSIGRTMHTSTTPFSSYYAKNEKKALDALKKINNAYMNLE